MGRVDNYIRDGRRVSGYFRSGLPIQRPPASASTAKAAATSAAEAESGEDEPDIGRWDDHEFMENAVAPDKSSPGCRRAARWRSQNLSSMNVTSVMGTGDGRHVVCLADRRNDDPSPRDARDDQSVSLGTFAVMGDFTASMGDADVSDGRQDWWVARREVDTSESLPWMLRQMRGVPDDADGPDELPTWDDMNNVALAYNVRTGDYAFPLYLDLGTNEQVILCKPELGAERYLDEPVGFAFVSKEEADSIGASDIDAVHDRLSYAAQALNDHLAGHPTRITAAFFDDDQADDAPTEVRHGEHFTWAEIADNFPDFVDEMLAERE